MREVYPLACAFLINKKARLLKMKIIEHYQLIFLFQKRQKLFAIVIKFAFPYPFNLQEF